MEKLSLFLLSIVFVLASCSTEEPDDPARETRPLDGNGKVFLESGKLVDANLDFTEAQLKDALSKYDWELDYKFCYDLKKVSEKKAIGGMPIKMHTDGIMEFDAFGSEQNNMWKMSVSGKKITSELERDPTSSALYSMRTFVVVALDVTETSGRIVMDYKSQTGIDLFDINTLYVRMVWHAVVKQ